MPLEADEQIRVVTYARKKGLLVFAVPNGGTRHTLEAVKLKQGGVSKGIPDLVFPQARKGYHGLYIELKRMKGSLTTDEQIYWIDTLNREGYLAVVCKGAETAIEVINNYFDIVSRIPGIVAPKAAVEV